MRALLAHLRRQSIGVLALFVALGGTSWAALTITGRNVKDGSITGADIQNGSLGTRDVKNGTLSGDDVEPDSLTGAQIEESTLGRVFRAKLADHAGAADSADEAGSAAQLDRGAGNRVFSAVNAQTTEISTTFKPLVTLSVPAGRYLVFANGVVSGNRDGHFQVTCFLRAGSGPGSDSDVAFITPRKPADEFEQIYETWSAMTPHAFSSGGSATVDCGTSENSTFSMKVRLIALQVGAINP